MQHQGAWFTLAAWAPKKKDRIQVQRSTVRFRVLAACKQIPHAILMAQDSAAYQRALARKQMLAAWVQIRQERGTRHPRINEWL